MARLRIRAHQVHARMDGEHPEAREEQKGPRPVGGTSPRTPRPRGNTKRPRFPPKLIPIRLKVKRPIVCATARLRCRNHRSQSVVDRITEIAVLRVGKRRACGRLVQPGQSRHSHSGNIQSLVGITDEMVAGAPAFPALAAELRRLLDDCVFVAHNARFDYGFIRTSSSASVRVSRAPVLSRQSFRAPSTPASQARAGCTDQTATD